jgi:hypothetical protein
VISSYHKILNEKLHGGKQRTLDSFSKMQVKEKSVMGKEPNDPKPGHSGPKTLVMVGDDEMAVDNPLSFSASPSSQ